MYHHFFEIRLWIALYCLCCCMLGVTKCNAGDNRITKADYPKIFSCSHGDYVCELEKISYEVFKELHNEIDDDKDGGLDPKEANDFVREELNYMDVNSRASKFSKYDNHISIDELWLNWKRSDVYKWSVNDVLHWVEIELQLPQYREKIILHKIDGQSLPKLAMKNMYFLSNILRIGNPIDKQKIRLKTIDLILFGPPKNAKGHLKDIFLSSCLAFTISLSFLGYQKYRDSEKCLRQLSLELDSLTESEISLKNLTSRLKKLEQRAQASKIEKENLKREYENEIFSTKLKAHNLSLERRKAEEKKEQLILAQQELAYTKSMLEKTERMQQNQLTSENLLLLLQLSFEMEMRYFENSHTKLQTHKHTSSKRKNCSECDKVPETISHEKTDEEFSLLMERWNKIEALTGLTMFPTPGFEKLRYLIDTTMKAESRRFFGKSKFKVPFPEPLPTVKELEGDECESRGEAFTAGPKSKLGRKHVLTRASTVQNIGYIRAPERETVLSSSSSCSAINDLENGEENGAIAASCSQLSQISQNSNSGDCEKQETDKQLKKKKRKFFKKPSFSRSFKNKN